MCKSRTLNKLCCVPKGRGLSLGLCQDNVPSSSSQREKHQVVNRQEATPMSPKLIVISTLNTPSRKPRSHHPRWDTGSTCNQGLPGSWTSPSACCNELQQSTWLLGSKVVLSPQQLLSTAPHLCCLIATRCQLITA